VGQGITRAEARSAPSPPSAMWCGDGLEEFDGSSRQFVAVRCVEVSANHPGHAACAPNVSAPCALSVAKDGRRVSSSWLAGAGEGYVLSVYRHVLAPRIGTWTGVGPRRTGIRLLSNIASIVVVTTGIIGDATSDVPRWRRELNISVQLLAMRCRLRIGFCGR
jgi:hypothetical protein